MMLVLGFILGYATGLLVLYLFFIRPILVGYLRVDRSDPYEEPYLFLELNRSVQQVTKNKYAFLVIKEEDFVPRN